MDWPLWGGGRRRLGFRGWWKGVFAPTEYEWGNGGRRGTKGGTMFRFETRLFEIWGKLQTLPPSKISDILRVGGRTVMSGVPNVGGIDFGRAHG